MPGANVSAKHERRGAVRPAFKDIRTAGFLADSVQVQALNQLQNIVLIGGVAQPNFQPIGLGLPRFWRIADDV